MSFKPQPGIPLKEIFTAADDDLIEVLKKMLDLYPLNRCTCSEALNMSYFSNKPPPTPNHLLPKPQSILQNYENERYSYRTSNKRTTESLAPLAKRLHFDNID